MYIDLPAASLFLRHTVEVNAGGSGIVWLLCGLATFVHYNEQESVLRPFCAVAVPTAAEEELYCPQKTVRAPCSDHRAVVPLQSSVYHLYDPCCYVAVFFPLLLITVFVLGGNVGQQFTLQWIKWCVQITIDRPVKAPTRKSIPA